MIITSSKRMFPLLGLLAVLCSGLLLTPMLSGCSKKDTKAAKTAPKKKGGKAAAKKAPAKKAKTPAKTAAASKPAVPAVFTMLTAYEKIPLDKPFEPGETETLMSIDPVKGISICETERLPDGKITLNTATGQIIRIESKKQYENEQEATTAFEGRKTALEKSLGLPPIRQMQGVVFSEITAAGEERSVHLLRSGRTVFEVVSVSPMPKNPSVPAGKPILSLFGLELGKPIPEKLINEDGMLLFYPDYPRAEFTIYNYFNDAEGNVQSIMAKSDPARSVALPEVMVVVRWLEEKFVMKMSYEGEDALAGVFQYSKDGRIVDLRWKSGKMTLSARISGSDRKN